MHPANQLALPQCEVCHTSKHGQYDNNDTHQSPYERPQGAKNSLALSRNEVQEIVHLVPYTLLTATGPNIDPNLALDVVPAEILTAPAAKLASNVAGKSTD